MRKACVVTDVGDAAYLLGSCGVVVPKEDAQALADGLTQVLNLSTAERAALGQRAHARIAAEFILIVFRINEHLGAIRDQGQMR